MAPKTKLRTVVDSVTVADVPTGTRLALAYVDGGYANLAAMRARLPKAQLITVTTVGVHDAAVADCETGDFTPASVAQWAHRKIAAGEHPTIYCNLSTLGAVLHNLDALGIKPHSYSIYTAHYTGTRHLCDARCLAEFDVPAHVAARIVATQYAWPPQTGHHYDLSVARAHWPGVDAPAGATDLSRAARRAAHKLHRHLTRRTRQPTAAARRDLDTIVEEIKRVERLPH